MKIRKQTVFCIETKTYIPFRCLDANHSLPFTYHDVHRSRKEPGGFPDCIIQWTDRDQPDQPHRSIPNITFPHQSMSGMH